MPSYKGKIFVIIGIVVVVGVIIGVWKAPRGSKEAGGLGAPVSSPQKEDTLRGNLIIKGSDTILPLAQAWAEEFMRLHPNVNISVTGGGSGVGISALLNGTCDIANASRPMKPSELKEAEAKGMKVKEIEVAIDGISIIVNPRNPIDYITLEQLKGIYTGKYGSWKDLGGIDAKIIPVGRDTASGTYEMFKEKVLGGEDFSSSVISTPSNNAIATTVLQDIGAIGYVGFAYAEEFAKTGKVKVIPVAKDVHSKPVMPSIDTIRQGSYPLFRELYNYTRGEPQGLVKAYLDFVLSPEGQQIVSRIGFIPVR